MSVNKITGVDKLLVKFKKEKKKKAKQFEAGLVRAGYLLLRYSLEIVPVLTGILRASGTVTVVNSGFKTIVHISYGTEYGLFVHEDPGNAHGSEFNRKHAERIARAAAAKKKGVKGATKYWFNRGPKQQYKFLTQPLQDHRYELITVVTDEMKL
jgi:hypothetical protein